MPRRLIICYLVKKTLAKNDKPLNLRLDGNVLERTGFTKFLGVFFYDKLTWHQHVNHVALKISRGLGMIGRVRNMLPFSVLQTLLFFDLSVFKLLLYNMGWC